MNAPAPRYAIYWVPPAGHALWQAGCAWLGRDPERLEDMGHFQALQAATALDDLRAQPRRYGFHATLKPPMRLRAGVDVDGLIEAAGRLAQRCAPLRMPPLVVATLGTFIALRPRDAAPVDAAHPLRRVADACVRELDSFRATSDPADVERRAREATLDDAQRRLLERWGCPWVFDTWRFHMTLTDALPDDATGRGLRDRLLAEAHEAFAGALSHPLEADGIALFVEDAPGRPLRLARRFPFGG